MEIKDSLPLDSDTLNAIYRLRPLRAAPQPAASAGATDSCQPNRSWNFYISDMAERIHSGGFCDSDGSCIAAKRLLGAVRGTFGRHHPDCGVTFFGQPINPKTQPDLEGIWGYEDVGCVPRKTPFVVRDASDRFVLGYDRGDLLPFGNGQQVAVWDIHRPRERGFLLPIWTSTIGSQPARLGISALEESADLKVAVQYWDSTLVVHTLSPST